MVTDAELIAEFDNQVAAFAQATAKPTYNIEVAFVAADAAYELTKQLRWYSDDSSRDWLAEMATWRTNRNWAQNAALAAGEARR